MIHLLLAAAMLVAFACLCAGNPRHQPHLFGRALARGTCLGLKCSAWALLAAAAVIACGTLGVGYGLVALFGSASVGALASVALLSHRVHKSRPRADR